MDVQSKPGKGTVFRLYLPRASRKEVPAPPSVSFSEPPIRKATILVVEDNPRLRRVLACQLADAGYEVAEAGDATAALAVLATRQPIDLLLTDIVIPGEMDGCKLAQVALARRPALRLVLTSGYCGRNPGDDWPGRPSTVLRKPFRRNELIKAVRTAIEAPSGACGLADAAENVHRAAPSLSD